MMPPRLFAALGAALVAVGCAGPYVRQVETPAIPAPLMMRIPLAVGVHYTPEFRAAQPSTSAYLQGGGSIENIWVVGEPSVAVFDTVLRGMFEKVVEVKQWPPADNRPEVAGVLVLNVPAVALPSTVYLPAGRAYIGYRVELFLASGEFLGAWDIIGFAASESLFVLGKTMVRDAMRSAAAAMVVSFFRDPQARAWLEANGVVPERLR